MHRKTLIAMDRDSWGREPPTRGLCVGEGGRLVMQRGGQQHNAIKGQEIAPPAVPVAYTCSAGHQQCQLHLVLLPWHYCVT